MTMLEVFRNNDKEYLRWAGKNSTGFVVNVDEPPTSKEYPMVHRATHRLLTSPNKQNYTTKRYFKVCSDDLTELEEWAQRERGRSLNPCGTCM
jgi:hypothetical protein